MNSILLNDAVSKCVSAWLLSRKVLWVRIAEKLGEQLAPQVAAEVRMMIAKELDDNHPETKVVRYEQTIKSVIQDLRMHNVDEQPANSDFLDSISERLIGLVGDQPDMPLDDEAKGGES